MSGRTQWDRSGKELPLVLPCGVIACVFIDLRPRKVTGKKLNLYHRPPGLWLKPETRIQKQMVSHSATPEQKGKSAEPQQMKATHQKKGRALENSTGQRGERKKGQA